MFKFILIAYALYINIAHADDLKLVDAARKQVGITKYYDSSYSKLNYPNGDVPRSKGICTDVIIRALRDAYQVDLQKLVHEDMSKHFAIYPKKWKLKHSDSNINHRRVPNLQVYISLYWQTLPTTQNPSLYQAGDVVTVMLPGHLPHIMLVSNIKDSATDTPLVTHNIGQGVREENSLFLYQMTGRYRLPHK